MLAKLTFLSEFDETDSVASCPVAEITAAT